MLFALIALLATSPAQAQDLSRASCAELDQAWRQAQRNNFEAMEEFRRRGPSKATSARQAFAADTMTRIYELSQEQGCRLTSLRLNEAAAARKRQACQQAVDRQDPETFLRNHCNY